MNYIECDMSHPIRRWSHPQFNCTIT